MKFDNLSPVKQDLKIPTEERAVDFSDLAGFTDSNLSWAEQSIYSSS